MGILYALEAIRNPVLNAVMLVVTYFGSEWLFIAAALIVYWCVRKKYGYYLMATGMIGTTVCQVLKISCRVPRPWIRDPEFTPVEAALSDARDYSFPSGHTQNVTSILGGVARFTKKKAVRIVCIVIVALVAFSRMYLGVHYPTDVLTGLVCGLVLVFGLYPIFEQYEENPRGLVIVFGATAVFALAAALVVEFRSWPEDIDSARLAETVKTLNMMFGCTAAVAISAPIERKKIRFDTKAPLWAQVLKVVLGLILVVGLRAALKPPLRLIFGGLGIADGIRYGLVVAFAILVWPLTFPWFAKGCPLGRTVKTILKIVGIVLLILVVLIGALLCWLGGYNISRIFTVVGVGTIITAFFMGPLIEFFNVHVARPFLNSRFLEGKD